MLTLTEAAKETGVTRPAIFKAIKSGRLSATKNDNGHFIIDAAELFRVYKPVNKVNETGKQNEMDASTDINIRLEMMSRLLMQVENERDDLRRRLDDESIERRKLTALLTYRPEQMRVQEDIINQTINQSINQEHRKNIDESLTQRLIRKIFW